ncbi:MAG TPA: TIGR02757 family protein [Bacteroidales bacterium]|nr:TIGR02757 family protein [Bacteroidales bacterium]
MYRYNGITHDEMNEFLDEKYIHYNNPGFIKNDPVSVPHHYTKREDIEISGFLTASIAWGRRDLIISAASQLMNLAGNSPHDFILNADDEQLERFSAFYYRTFNGIDCTFFIRSLKNIYRYYNSLEDILVEEIDGGATMREAIIHFREHFFSIPHQRRTQKHFADIGGAAAGKRLNMFFRWMVRNDGMGVDFGLWDRISPSQLYIPLDLHSGNTSRKLGLLKRKANDWKAVEELTDVLRRFDKNDPVKYDFALFGLGINEKF